MAEVLVLVDHVDGKVRKTTSELLTIARRIGEPSAVFIGAGFDAAKETLVRFGAEAGADEDGGRLTDAARDRQQLGRRLADLAVDVVDEDEYFSHACGSPSRPGFRTLRRTCARRGRRRASARRHPRP